MNGRVFAVNRSPVLAWNIEPQLQVPYPDMPAAAAAAISPIVPAASDPYGRCWQNQVDAGTSFPYFGTLYNNSLPPTAYRLQAGCMPNLGQFWPPTPPPDGCGRFDGSNLYFGPPVLRHPENISSNIRSSFQGLGHYSHLVETSKEQNQRMFKRETPISPNVSVPNIAACSASKSDNYNSCCVDKLKSQNSVAYSLPKQELLTVSSGHEPYLCAPDIRSSSSVHPSTDKSCFSPSHSLKNTSNFHSSSQDNAHRAKSLTGNQENCNASPLKNVYFSHFESENVSSLQSKNFEKTGVRDFQYEHKNSSPSIGNKSKPPNNYHHLGSYPPKKYDLSVRQDYNGSSANGSARDGIMLIKEHFKQKTGSFKVKPEKNHSDCKFQKNGSKNSTIVQGPEYKNSDVFNIPTSVMHPKIEPSDKYFLPSCSSTTPSYMPTYATSSPYLMEKESSVDLRTGVSYQNSIFQNSCSLTKPWQYNELPSISLENYFRSPEAAQLPSQNAPRISPALHEGLISVAQTAPQDINVEKGTGTLQCHAQPITFPKRNSKTADADDEVQIIGVQMKHSSSKQESRHMHEKTSIQAPVTIAEPLCLRNENESIKLKHSEPATKPQVFKSLPCLTSEKIIPMDNRSSFTEEKLSLPSENSNSVSENSSTSSSLPLKTVSIKPELPIENKTTDSVFALDSTESVHKSVIANNLDEKTDCDSDVPEGSSFHAVKPEEQIAKESENEYCENHGLNLLLKSIERITSLERNEPIKSIDSEVSLIEGKTKGDWLEKFNGQKCSTRGLDMLSVIAGQRLVSEFDAVKTEPEESRAEHEESCIKSNYPDIKEKCSSEDDQVKPKSETACDSFKSSVFEMQNRLAELRKKYKQKQKELSRLKPKKRFATTYLKGRQKVMRESSEHTSASSATCDSLNSSFSSVSTDQDIQNPKSLAEISSLSEPKTESADGLARKRIRRHLRASVKSEHLDSCEQSRKRITRHSLGKSKSSDKCYEISEQSRNIRKNLRSKASKLGKSIELSLSQINDVSQAPSSKSTSRKELSKNSSSLPENNNGSKVYALRHSSQSSSRKFDSIAVHSAATSKTLSSKRKSDNPRKYMPSKQSKLSETIIAKHLRNRILFDTSCATSDDENFKDGVPDDLYDAMMKCHLEDPKNGSKLSKVVDISDSVDVPLSCPEPSRLSDEHLVENQRLLALEDGLFYAGYVKEYHSSKKYGIALDGQRGNRLHMFTREELLTQTIVESKPLTSELPEGTRVCAYWSQQYRCLYPGVVGKAPCPSADWSEPRVFVLFDDGDSGQIPTKNVRLIPPDIISSETAWKTNTITVSSRMESRANRGRTRRLRCSTPVTSNSKHCDAGNENESKDSSCGSLNESSCDDSCFNDLSLSPSHTPEDCNNIENSVSCFMFNSSDNAKSGKRQRKRSRRRTSRRTKFGPTDSVAPKEKCEAKTKRHKKYKDKHRRHHHHHHRHHHRHHHHHHSKKHKHRRKNGKSTTSSQDTNYENCIPCNSYNLKSSGNTVGACTDLIEHSSTENLPQSEQDRVC